MSIIPAYPCFQKSEDRNYKFHLGAMATTDS
uniref:Uncharacterized protein n=1 Tax=Podoviridae sp. ct8Lf7 TaxID=2827723 RepID=A0A8S5S0Z6_9CAUD|nr:MAG TPA: hypothetical protein [Podoviridae sp. ct8Lf7]